jgi:hypothetical protein
LRLRPRTHRTLAAALLACALFSYAPAQSQSGKQGARKRTDNATARAGSEVRVAVAALKEAAATARSFDDPLESVRMQSEAADALWPYDERAARLALRDAWEVATAHDAEDKVRGEEDSEEARAAARDDLLTSRRLVVETALKHDAQLAEGFMREFEHDLRPSDSPFPESEEAPHDPASAQAAARRPGWSSADWQRIYVARQLLKGGAAKSAAEAAAPLVSKGPTPQLVDFVLDLRASEARAADALYLRLLAATRADEGADANDVLILSTPVISPGQSAVVRPDGSVSFAARYYVNEEARRAASSLPAEVRGVFFGTAAAVLLRGGTLRGAGRAAAPLYFTIGRLLPFFEREAAQFAPALHARRAALAAELDAARRDALEAKMEVREVAGNPADPLASATQAVEHARDAAGRDLVRLGVVRLAAGRRLWDRARKVADELEGPEARRAARLLIAVEQVMNLSAAYAGAEGDDFERAADFARAADVPPEVRAAGLAQAAELAARRGKGARGHQLLAEAAGLAAGAEPDAQRVTSLALVALSAARVGGALVWELLPSLVGAADDAGESGVDELRFSFMPALPNGMFPFSVSAAPSRLADVFAAAARLDPARALAEARAFKSDLLRAEALLAAARASLEKNARTGARVLRRGPK